MDYKPAPGVVVCKLNPDVTEKDSFIMPGQRNNWATVVSIGPRGPMERLFKNFLKVGDTVLLPSSRYVFDEDFCAVKYDEIRTKL